MQRFSLQPEGRAVNCGGKLYARSSASRLELYAEANSPGGELVESRMKSFHLFEGYIFVLSGVDRYHAFSDDCRSSISFRSHVEAV